MADFPRDSAAVEAKASNCSNRLAFTRASSLVSHDESFFALYPAIAGRYTIVFSKRLSRFGRDFGPGSLGRIVSHEVRGVIRSNLPYLPLFPPLPPPPSPPLILSDPSRLSGGSLGALVLFRTYTRTLFPSLFLSFSLSRLSLASGILTERPRSSLVVAFGADSRTFSIGARPLAKIRSPK